MHVAARMQAADVRVVGWAVRTRGMVLKCAMTGADGRGDMHACVGSMSCSRAGCGGPSLDRVRLGVIVFLYLKKNYCRNRLC
jgi:hypothetical protein